MTTDNNGVSDQQDPEVVAVEEGDSPEQPPVEHVGRQLAASVILPGVSALQRSVALGVGLLVVGCVLPVALLVWIYVHRDDLIGFALDQQLLTIVVLVVVASVLARVVAVAEIARTYWSAPAARIKTAIAGVAVVALAVPASGVAYQANETRQTVGEVFSTGDDNPLFLPDAAEPFRPAPLDPETDQTGQPGQTGQPDDRTDVADDDVAPAAADADGSTDTPAASPSSVDPNAVRTTLLLGGDDGPRRWGMRTDTMILLSVHEASGRIALVSIPRNLTQLHFPPDTPLGIKFPNGFNDLANAVSTHVTTRDELVEAYGAGGQPPEVVALAQGIGYSLDIKIDDFVLVNMQGFLDIVDAVGGVRVYVPKKVLLQKSNPVGDYDPPESLGPGKVDMDGTLAIAYVRARRGDSDYFRMERQRQVLAALGSQVSTRDAINAFPSVSRVLGDSMRTSLSAAEFSELLDQIGNDSTGEGDNASIGESVGLVPPLITPSRPDYANIQSIVDAVEHYVLTGEPSGFDS